MISVGGKVTGSVLIDEGGLAAVDEAGIRGGETFAGVNGFAADDGVSVENSGVNAASEAARSVLNAGVEGVTVSANREKNLVPWVKGQSGNPSGRSRFARSIVKAIAEDSPPERIIGMLNHLEDIAIAQRSWRGMAEALRIRLEYTEGKPIQRTMTVQAKLGSMLERMAGLTVDADVVREVVSDDGE
jgi:hypothetical protein